MHKISEIEIKNFRKHRHVKLHLDKKLTVIAGENDVGKTSILEAIDIVLGGRKLSEKDFLDGKKSLSILIKYTDVSYLLEANKIGDKIESLAQVIFPHKRIKSILDSLENLALDELMNLKSELLISSTATTQSGLIKAIRSSIEKATKNALGVSFPVKNLPNINVYQLDGKKFDDINGFIYQMYFRNRRKEIWNSSVGELTLLDFVNEQAQNIASETEQKIKNEGFLSNLSEFLPDIKDIQVSAQVDLQDISLKTQVKFIDIKGNSKDFQQLGDGTLRRATFALLKHNGRENGNGLYILDEPDTHLHVKAQLELLDSLERISDEGGQVIITTHSPFIINAIDIDKIRILRDVLGESKVNNVSHAEGDRSTFVRELGVENIHLFFSRKILIVEGETEERFFPIFYRKRYGRSINRDLIKVINRRGVGNIPRFVRVALEFMYPENIFVFVDSDAVDEYEAIVKLLPEKNVYRVGRKAFEDAFSASVLHKAWEKHLHDQSITPDSNWTQKNIEEACSAEPEGLISRLKELNKKTNYALTKPLLGEVLARYSEEGDIPTIISTLMDDLTSDTELKA